MSSRSRWSILAVFMIGFAVLGILGWQQWAPKPTLPTIITVTPTMTTVAGSQTIVTPQRQTEWIRIGEMKPINFYLSLLESNGTQPYAQLAKELRKLPDQANATALAKITYLALNATNPEVKEALELMMRGGTPDPKDYKYPVPEYNTELQVLYWIASQNELKRDDTLALAMAMVNGFWVTMGNEQVRGAVKRDTSELLIFFRETNELQERRGYFLLEKYPLEAKLCLCWTGGDPARGGRAWYQLMSGGPRSSQTLNTHHFLEHENEPITLSAYKWNTVSIKTIKHMQTTMLEKNWIERNIDETVRTLEEYFYLSKDRRWIFTQPNDALISFENEQTINHNMNNPNLIFDYYIRTGTGLGVCGDEASLVECLCKSSGISTIRLTRTYGAEGGKNHDHIVYYEPLTQTWRCYERQLRIGGSGKWNIYLFKPQVVQRNYYLYRSDSQQTWMRMANLYYTTQGMSAEQAIGMFLKGVVPSEMKQWLLYT